MSRFLFASLLLATPALAQPEPPVFDDLPLRSIGPAVMAGRISDLAVTPGRPYHFYAATASGGLFRTRNNGITWDSLFDHYGTTSLGAVELAPSDPETVWVGTGEPANRQSSSFGDGVYVSRNGGDSFRHAGLEESEHIGRILIHPDDPGFVYVAALGPLWRSGGQRGVFRTRDAGRNWEQVLAISADTGVVDMEMDPRDPAILYAAAYTRRRTPWGFNGGGPESGIFRSFDGGDTWERLAAGIPEGPLGRIGLEISESEPRTLYATIEHATESGTYRSDDRGDTWRKVNDLNPRPMYYSHIEVDPVDPSRIHVLGAPFFVSDDGGQTFAANESMTPTYDIGVHGDHHALWIDPEENDHLLLGNDGGIHESWDRGLSWRKLNNIPLAQFYAISLDMETPYNIYGGAQDTHSWMGPSETRRQAGILNADWLQTNFGDGMDQAGAPGIQGTAFASSQNGGFVRLDTLTGNRTPIRPIPEEGEDRYRFHWLSPLMSSPHEPGRIFLGGNRFFASDDLGGTWRASEDLTLREDRSELSILGVLPAEGMLSMHDGVAAWGTLTTLAESPRIAGLIYVGTDGGRVARSEDGGISWTFLEENLPLDVLRATISRVTPSSHDGDRLYVAVDRHQLGDFAPYIFVSEDRGSSFEAIADGLPRGWVNDIVEHPEGENLLIAGTEVGGFLSFDRGRSWMRVGGGLPHVPVDDIEIHPRELDIVFGTHGRSLYILDDSGPLARRAGNASQVFGPTTAHVFLPWKDESYEGQARYAGENPPPGALLTVFLTEADAAGPVALQILDSTGEVLAEPALEARPGFQRTSWDLRRMGSMEDGRGVCRSTGPRVATGTWQARLTAGGRETTVPVEVALDPGQTVTGDAYRERSAFLENIHRTVMDACAVFASHEDAPDATEAEREALARLRPTGGFRNPSDLARLARLYGSFTGDQVRQGTLVAPTPLHRREAERLTATIREAMATLGQ